MLTVNATEARRDWSAVLDSVIREKPAFIKRTRDYVFLTDLRSLETLLEVYTFSAVYYYEDDGSVTLSLDQLDLVENGNSEQDARIKLSASILEYANDYYTEFSYWARGDRKSHIPYVLKALVIDDVEKIGGLIECRHGKI